MTNRDAVQHAALDALSRREHSRWELSRKLTAKKGFEAVVVAEVLEVLAEKGWLSDERFADAYVRERVNKGYGPVRLCQELRQRGISSELIAETVDSHTQAWVEYASRARQKRFGEELPGTLKERAKQSRFLSYRGFTSEHIRAALAEDNLYTSHGQ
ncbi:MAG: regulatory protein RecX [Gammaproteobacteria bacterium]|nr:regulatory protein RecX [Gammaproteobacteria bacterium]